MSKTSEALNKAADIIEQDGWFGGEGEKSYEKQMDRERHGKRSGTEKCLVFAVAAATKGTTTHAAALNRVRRLLGIPITRATQQGNRADLVEWNDKRGRKKSEVVGILRQAAQA